MCRGQCNPRSALLAGGHVAVVLLSIAAGVLLAVNKLSQAAGCPLTRRYEMDYVYNYPSDDFLCDMTLYLSLLSAAIAFLCVMVNWVAGIHKSIRWQRAQLVLTFVGVATINTSAILHTSGLLIWCQNLLHQKKPQYDDQADRDTHHSSCLQAAREWDIYQQQYSSPHGISAAHMYALVVPAEVIIIFTTILWQTIAALTMYVTFLRYEEHRQSYVRQEDEDEDEATIEVAHASQMVVPTEPTRRAATRSGACADC